MCQTPSVTLNNPTINPNTIGTRLGLPNPVPSLGVPGFIPPASFPSSPGVFAGQTSPKGGMNLPMGVFSPDPNAQGPSILGLLGRGVLDTTILGQARRAPSALPYGGGPLGG